jgi:TRAP-type C4-dicarboxylate transport system permease small subunit
LNAIAPPERSLRVNLSAAHDAVTRAGFHGAAACLVVITCAYFYEVIARYFFGAPTSWSSALVSYALCGMVFMAMPELSRQRIHIVINMLLDWLSPAKANRLRRVLSLAAGAVCLLAAWFSFDATVSQYQQGIQTLAAWPIEKWSVSSFIVYGMLSTSIYFLRQAAGEKLADAEAATSVADVG